MSSCLNIRTNATLKLRRKQTGHVITLVYILEIIIPYKIEGEIRVELYLRYPFPHLNRPRHSVLAID